MYRCVILHENEARLLNFKQIIVQSIISDMNSSSISSSSQQNHEPIWTCHLPKKCHGMTRHMSADKLTLDERLADIAEVAGGNGNAEVHAEGMTWQSGQAMSEGGLAQLSGIIGVSIRSSVSFLLVERLARQSSNTFAPPELPT